MKNANIVILLSILTLSACGQSKVNCNQIRNEKPHVLEYKQGSIDSVIALDIEKVRQCMDFDSIDNKILSHNVLAVQIYELKIDMSDLNYGSIIDHINEIRSTDDYQKSRESFGFAMKYDTRLVKKADSVEVRAIFEKMGVTGTDMDNLMKEIYSDENSNRTYNEAYARYIESLGPKRTKESVSSKSAEKLFGHFRKFETKKQLKENSGLNRPQLLYLTGYKDINGRKMEEALFHDPEIQNLLSEFECFIAYTDDKSEISNEQRSEILDNELRTQGQYFSEVKNSLSLKESQPIVLIVDNEFQLIDFYSDNKNKQDFIEFLKRNRNVR